MVRGGPLRQAVLPFTQAVTSSACNIQRPLRIHECAFSKSRGLRIFY
jgi:hypothetical protein